MKRYSISDVNLALARALGVPDPEHCSAITLTIKAGAVPQILVRRYVTGAAPGTALGEVVERMQLRPAALAESADE